MGPTWKSIAAVVIGLTAICSAHGHAVPFLATADVHACLMLSYSVVPQPGSQSVSPDEPRVTDAERRAATPPDVLGIVAYVAALELLLAVMAAFACLLVLALAGFVIKGQRRRCPAAVPAESSSAHLFSSKPRNRRSSGRVQEALLKRARLAAGTAPSPTRQPRPVGMSERKRGIGDAAQRKPALYGHLPVLHQ